MKNIRVFVVLLLLAIAAPIAIHYRAWSLGVPGTAPALPGTPQSANYAGRPVEPRDNNAPAAKTNADQASEVSSSQPSINPLDLPAASSSLPLLSVIGFGIFIGGLISALRTRPAHK